MVSSTTDIFRIYWSSYHLSADVNVFILIGVGVLIVIFAIARHSNGLSGFFSPEIQLSIPLGGLGSVSLKADYSITQIAYTAWAELITRKAGLPIDPQDDVIVEVYSSWYQLFGTMRELIKTIPAPHLRKKNTKVLINLLIGTLNKGLRPHLTKWQAKFKAWYDHELARGENVGKTPQEIQRSYPEYKELMTDLLNINKEMVVYTNELKKLVKLETHQ